MEFRRRLTSLHDTKLVTPRNGIALAHRILLVDDDAVSLEIVALMLESDGHEVMRACDGKTALDLLFDANPPSPDVLLIDLQMPGISGGEVAKRIETAPRPRPRLLAMSATAVGRKELQGFDGFLLKPLGIDDLRAALAAIAQPTSDTVHRAKNRKASRRHGPVGSHSSGAGEAIDQAVLSKLAKAMPPNALREVYEACIADTRRRVSTLREQALAGNVEEVRRGAHQVKGAASMIGAARIARSAMILELGSCKEEATLRLLEDLLDATEELERILLADKLQKTNDDAP
jgi:CheY-like chemotaxis protein/HPt (histidine-containing phosphotransfer) domain-containing protein